MVVAGYGLQACARVQGVRLEERGSVVRVGFGGSDKYSSDVGDYPDSPIRTKNAFRVFNHVFYILKLIIENYNVSEFKFTGARDGLIVVYSKLHHNKFFVNELRKLGFEFKGDDKGTFVYGKI
jgi:hypothetical protein